MPLPITGKISFSQLQTEFGGSNPISFSEYYRDSTTKFAYAVTASPLTGNVIKMSNLRGASKAVIPNTLGYEVNTVIIASNTYWTLLITIYYYYDNYEVVRSIPQWIQNDDEMMGMPPDYYEYIYGYVERSAFDSKTIIHPNTATEVRRSGQKRYNVNIQFRMPQEPPITSF
jgi:hypothetical protein